MTKVDRGKVGGSELALQHRLLRNNRCEHWSPIQEQAAAAWPLNLTLRHVTTKLPQPSAFVEQDSRRYPEAISYV